MYDELIKRLHRYSENCVAYKLDADFADAVQQAADELERLQRELKDCRNELCLKCGKYRDAHLGACNGCRWKR